MWLANVNPEAMRKKKYCCLANVNHHTHIIQWKHLHSKVFETQWSTIFSQQRRPQRCLNTTTLQHTLARDFQTSTLIVLNYFNILKKTKLTFIHIGYYKKNQDKKSKKPLDYSFKNFDSNAN